MDLTANVIGAIAMAAASLPLPGVGWLVSRGNLGLLNGVDTARVRDRDALASQASRWLFAMGVALLGGAVALLAAPVGESMLLWITIGTLLVVEAFAAGLVLAIVRARRSAARAGTGTVR